MTLTRHVRSFIAVFAGVTLLPAALWACAGCRNPNIPQARQAGGAIDRGAVLIGASLSTSPTRVSHPAGCVDVNNCVELPVQPEHTHDLTLIPTELRINTAWAATQVVGIDADLPVRLVSAQVEYRTPDGAPYEPIDAGVHHRDEVIAGLGDLALRVRLVARADRWWLTTRVGMTLPTGGTEPDPYEAGEQGHTHQHIQFGTGTVDPTLSFDATRSSTRAEVSLYAQGQASLYSNRHGFQGPPRMLAGSAAAWKNGTGLLLGGAIETAVEGAERWQGVARPDASLGRTELLIGPNVSYTFGRTSLSAMVRVVAFRQIVRGSEELGDINAPIVAAIGAGWTI